MPTRYRHAPVFLVLLALTPHIARAAEPFARVGTYVNSFVAQPRGVRSLGMGSTGVASVYAVASGYVNPATLAWADAAALAADYQDWGSSGAADLGISHTDSRLSGGWLLSDDAARDRWRVGGFVGYSREDMDAQAVRTIFLPEGTGQTTEPVDHVLIAAGALSWTRGRASVGAGLSAKYLDLWSVDGWAFDWGALAAFSFAPGGMLIRPRIGFSLSNLDSRLEGTDRGYVLVGETRTGLGVDLAASPVAFGGRHVPGIAGSLELEHAEESEGGDEYEAIGWELAFIDLLQIRVGQRLRGDSDMDTWGLGLGWVFGRWMVRADYAHEWWTTLLGPRQSDTFGLATGLEF